MMGNFASLHAYISAVAVAQASSESSEAPSARPLSDDASLVLALGGAIVDKGKLITSAASRQPNGRALTDDRAVSLFRRAA